jgi:uncharacterized glyoxalase superfamily protein PhnB
MARINPSLMFTGACGDAFRRYASLFGGEIVMMLTYAESPLQQANANLRGSLSDDVGHRAIDVC